MLSGLIRDRGELFTPIKGGDELLFINRWLSGPTVPKPAAALTSVPMAGSVKEMIDLCLKCGQISERKYPFGSGINGVMIILNSPRLLSRVERGIYKKESIDMLKKMIDILGVSFSDTYITNLLKCEVEDTLSRTSSITKSCEGIIIRELELISPKVAVLFGDITPIQKIVRERAGIFWFNIEHPIALIKNPDLKRAAWGTLKNAKAKIDELAKSLA